MPIPVACPVCGARLSVPDTAAGKQVKCPKCQATMAIPAADAGFEVVEETPPARSAMARPVAARPARSRPVEEDEDDDRPRRRVRDEEEADDDYDDDRPRRKPMRKRPKKKSGGLPIVLLIAAGGIGLFVVIGGLVAYLLLGRSGGKPQVVASNGPPGMAGNPFGGPPGRSSRPSTPVRVPAGWTTFSPPGGNLTVSVPTKLQSFSIPGRMRQGNVSVAIWQALHGNKVYQVSITTQGKRMPAGDVSDRVLDKFCDGFVSSAKLGQERSRTRISMGGHNGRQVVLSGAKSVIARMTIVGQRAYVLTVAVQGAADESDPDIAAFLQSAQISG